MPDRTLPDHPTSGRTRPARPAALAPPRHRAVAVRIVLWAAAVTLLAAGLAVALLSVTGQLAAAALFDAGALVRYALPAVRSVHDLAAALTVGTLVTATWLVGPEPARPDAAGELDGAGLRLTRIGAVAARTWFVLGVLGLLLAAADISGEPLSTPGFGTIVVSFVVQIELGRALAISVGLAGLVAALAWSAIRVSATGVAAVLAIIAVLPLALAGHSATSANHMLSVDSLGFHLVGVCLWIGGLAAVLLVLRQLDRPAVVLSRYSTLAGWCFAIVAGSGVVNALLRLGSFSQLGSGYGLLVIAKVVAVGLLGLAGALHRRRTIGAIGRRPAAFVRLAVVELTLMALTIGLAVALSRSAPPAGTEEVDPITGLLGFPLPPPLTPVGYLLAFWPSLLWLAVAAGAAAGYLVSVARLRRRGGRWSPGRTTAWLLGCLLLVAATSGGIGLYGSVHFSTHLVQHLVLMLAVPVLWVLGSPVTLAHRSWQRRTDGSLGAVETIDQLERSTALGLLSHPVVSGIVLFGGFLVFYRTQLFELAIGTHTGHVLMTTGFLAAGCLFVRSLVDPTRSIRSTRIVVGLGAGAVLVAFGLATRGSSVLLAADWWAQLGQTDDLALLADQRSGGLVAIIGGLLVVTAVAVPMIINPRAAITSNPAARPDEG